MSITDIKEEFRVIPKTVSVAAGESIVLQCSAPKAQPEAKIHWLKNGNLLELNEANQINPKQSHSMDDQLLDGVLEHVKILSSGALRILNVGVQDRGRYSCVATNIAGVRESPPALLSVNGK